MENFSLFSPLADVHLPNPFSSFWMAGYECADMKNADRERVDLSDTTGHLQKFEEDYALLKPFQIQTVREGIRWAHIEKAPFHYDWSAVRSMIEIGRKAKIQQLWDLCHFGYPDDLSPLDCNFEPRFVSLARSFVRLFRSVDPESTIIVTPVNEVGFISWLGGEEARTVPYLKDAGWHVKYALMKAYIAAIKAMKSLDNNLLVLTTEPLVNIVPPLNASDEEIENAGEINGYQFQVTDILEGRFCGELGGSADLVDIHGLNYYYNNQWIANSFEYLPWANEQGDPRWKPLHELIRRFYNRYGKPVILSETSHPKEHRPNWFQFISEQCNLLTDIPFWGVCWYPIIDRPDWDDLTNWHRAGLWDVDVSGPDFTRKLYAPLADAFRLVINRFVVD